MADQLAVWLYGSMVAVIDEERRRSRLTYTDDALRRYPLGTPLLSLSLPLRAERFPQGIVKPFIDGLLPEGESRRLIARAVRVDPEHTYGLIEALGRDCAGAVVIQPMDEMVPPPSSTLSAEPLSREALTELVRNLRSAPLGAGGLVRVSLAGVQEKLLLTRMPDGKWGLPVKGTPSTHILKPEIADYPNTVENEAFCMRLAKNLGVAVADVETTHIAGRKLIVVERYDRRVAPDGGVERIHQEDFCQATATRPGNKYQDDGGPSLATLARIVDSVAVRGSVEALFRAVVVNLIVGNGDAHAKNFSLLHESSGVVRLAPMYDRLSTLPYGDDRLAMYVDNVRRSTRVTAGRVVNEGARWGLARSRCIEIVEDMLGRVPDAIAAARAKTVNVPDAVLSAVRDQCEQLRT